MRVYALQVSLMTEPLPCPWCPDGGKVNVYDYSNGEWYVECGLPSCCMGPSRPTREEAVAAWNRVAGAPAEVARLREGRDRDGTHHGPAGNNPRHPLDMD